MARSTFNENDHALYKIGAETVSVRVVRCSFYCPPFDNHAEQSFYTVQLDGDVPPAAPKLDIHTGLIHRVPLAELERRTPSADYATNTGLWTLKVEALTAAAAAAEAEKRYTETYIYVKRFAPIKPGMTIVWQGPDEPDGRHPLAQKAVVEQIDLLKRYCVVTGDRVVKLDEVIHLEP